jgi:hypothetical protein
MLLSTYSCLLLITGLGHVAQLMGWMQLHANCIITLQIKILKKKQKKKTPSKRTREEKKKGLNSKQKTRPENAKFVAAEKSMREST